MLGPDGQPLAPAIRKGKKPPEKPAPDESPTLFFGLGIGSGVGWTTGKGEVNATSNVVNPAGFAMSRLLHFAPEVGYYRQPGPAAVGAAPLPAHHRRHRLPLGYEQPARRLRRRRRLPGGQVRVRRLRAGELLLRRGRSRARMSPARRGSERSGTSPRSSRTRSAAATRQTTCVDTVPSGPVFVGGGAGIMYNLQPCVRADASEPTLLLGFTKFTFHVDLNAGVAFEY